MIQADKGVKDTIHVLSGDSGSKIPDLNDCQNVLSAQTDVHSFTIQNGVVNQVTEGPLQRQRLTPDLQRFAVQLNRRTRNYGALGQLRQK